MPVSNVVNALEACLCPCLHMNKNNKDKYYPALKGPVSIYIFDMSSERQGRIEIELYPDMLQPIETISTQFKYDI